MSHDLFNEDDQFLVQTNENGEYDVNSVVFQDKKLSENQKQILFDRFTKGNTVSAVGMNKVEQMGDMFLPEQQVCVNGGIFGSLENIQQQKGYVIVHKDGQLKVSGMEDIEDALILNHLNLKKPVETAGPQLVLAYETESGLLKRYHEGIQADSGEFS